MRPICLFLAILTLPACSTFGTRSEAPQRLPAANLVAECPSLPEPADGSPKELAKTLVEVAGIYWECRAKFDGLREWAQGK